MMLFNILLTVVGLIYHHGHKSIKKHENIRPTLNINQTSENEVSAVSRNGPPYIDFVGDMVFPDDYNKTEGGIRKEKYRWYGYPGGCVVPYTIDPQLNSFRKVILEAMEQFERQTCCKFVPKTNEKDWIIIFYSNGCWSVVGRAGGPQHLSLGFNCFKVGTILHQLGHALGLFHEHQRSDRDTYINVYKDNVFPSQLFNFDRTDPKRELIFSEYDYDSIMHLGNYAYSRNINRLKTMEAKNKHPLHEPYMKSGITQSDIVNINKLYRC